MSEWVNFPSDQVDPCYKDLWKDPKPYLLLLPRLMSNLLVLIHLVLGLIEVEHFCLAAVAQTNTTGSSCTRLTLFSIVAFRHKHKGQERGLDLQLLVLINKTLLGTLMMIKCVASMMCSWFYVDFTKCIHFTNQNVSESTLIPWLCGCLMCGSQHSEVNHFYPFLTEYQQVHSASLKIISQLVSWFNQNKTTINISEHESGQ